MKNDPPEFDADNNEEFERPWRKIAAGVKDVPEQKLDDEINRAVEEVRAELYRARNLDQTTRNPNS